MDACPCSLQVIVSRLPTRSSAVLRFYSAFVNPRTAGLKAAATVFVLVVVAVVLALTRSLTGIGWSSYSAIVGGLLGLLIGATIVASVPDFARGLMGGIAAGLLAESSSSVLSAPTLSGGIAATSFARLSATIFRLAETAEDAATQAGIVARSESFACGAWMFVGIVFLVIVVSPLFDAMGIRQ